MIDVSSVVTLNPFPGLRPFQEDEDYLFFGREHQVDTMVDILAKRQFLAVVGSSGSGKSSLVNCGLEPALHQGLMASAGASWRIVKFRPGDRPIKAMAQAMAADGVLFRNFKEHGLSLFEVVDSTLRMSTVGLLDIVEQASLNDTFNLLVVVDQFEELFRYRQLVTGEPTIAEGFSEEATAFVSLLLEVLEKPQHQIHIVLTMRSDFLGDCTKFPGLAEAINSSLYLVPRMTRDERRDAINNPVLVAGATITPVLVTRLVNDVGDNPDQLSILQHALNRTWARWKDEGGIGPVDLPHYQAIGTMAEALDRHAQEAYGELAEPGQDGDDFPLQKLCRRTFQALTDKASDGRGIRRPTKWITLREITKASEPQLLRVIEVFREPSRSFLMPPAGTEIEDESVIDISHESLMRVWRRLSSWGDEEARWADAYRRLAESAVRHREGSESLLRDPALQIALNWWQDSHPNEAWARRYHPGFQAAKVFLNQSAEARAEEQDAEQRELAQRQRRDKNALIGSVLIAITAMASAGWMWRQQSMANQQVARTWAAVAEGLMKEHKVEPETSIKLSLAALNRQFGKDTSESVKMIVNLLNAIELYGEQAASHVEKSETRIPIYSLAAIGKGDQLVSAGPNGAFRVWDINLGDYARMVSEANLADPIFLELRNGNVIAAGVLANDIGDQPKDEDRQGVVRLQLWNSDMKNMLAEKNPKLSGVRFVKQNLVNGSLVIGDFDGISLWNQDLSRIRSVSINSMRSLTVLKAGGKILVSLNDKDGYKLQLWSADLLTLLKVIPLGKDPNDAVDSLLQLENGTIVSGGFDGSLQLWSASLQPIGPKIDAQSRQILSLAQLGNKELITGSADGTLRRWLVSKEGLSALHLPFPADQGQIQTLLAVNSILVSGGSNGSLKRWQWEKGFSSGQPSDPKTDSDGYEAVITSPYRGGEIYRIKSGRTDNEKQLEFGAAHNKHGKLNRTRLVSSSKIPIIQYILPLRVNPDTKEQELLVTGHYDGSVRRWRSQGKGKDWFLLGSAYQVRPLPPPLEGQENPAPTIHAMTELSNGDVVVGMNYGWMQRLRFTGETWSDPDQDQGPCKPNFKTLSPGKLKTLYPGTLDKAIYSLTTLANGYGDLVSGSRGGAIIRWKRPVQEWCKHPAIILGGDESEIFSMAELNDSIMLTSTGNGGLTLWKWENNSTSIGEIVSIYWRRSSLIASISYVPGSQDLVVADFQGNFKVYPGLKAAIALGCRTLNDKLSSLAGNQLLKPFEMEATAACKPWLATKG